MTKFTIIIASILFFYSCKTEEQKTLTADSVELAYSNGWTGGVSLRITRNGIENYNLYDIHGKTDNETCYKDTLNNQAIDSINSYLALLKTERIDSLFDGNCEDCGGYIFIINYPDTVIKTMIIGTHRFKNNLTKFAKFLLEQKPNTENRIDTCIEFETTKILKPPIPPLQYHKFIPPKNGS